MSHLLDIENVFEKLILLQHFAHGSKQFCSEQLIGSEQDIGDGKIDEYWSWVKGIVSNYTLECSIRYRELLDTIRDNVQAEKIISLDHEVRSGLLLGQIVEGNFELTIRETCNKIIHARKVIPVWATGKTGDIEFRYWSGDLDLAGTKSRKNWRLILHTATWAHCLGQFLDKAETAELYDNVGQDWY